MGLLVSVVNRLLQLKHPQTIRTQVSTDLHFLEQVLTWFDQFRPAFIPRSIWLECRLILAEGFTNAVRHAHFEKPTETPIEIEVTFKHRAIELRVWDYGSGFDLEERLHALPDPKNQVEAGGRGLKIIQRTADKFSYTAADSQRNCLWIVKRYSS